MPSTLAQKTPLSGADYFQLVLDKHIRKHGTVGNVSRVIIELDGKLNLQHLQNRLNSLVIFNWMKELKMKRSQVFGIPYWKRFPTQKDFPITEHLNATEVPIEVLNRDICAQSGTLFHIDLIQKTNNKSTFVYSVHHSLMDSKGVQLLMKILGEEDLPESLENYFPVEIPSTKSLFYKLQKSFEAKHFIERFDFKNMATLLEKTPKSVPRSRFDTIQFTKEESELISKNAKRNGARFGNSSFYLACIARGLNHLLERRGKGSGDFWAPLPQNQRLRGSKGPVFSNQLSFMFFRIPKNNLHSLPQTIDGISKQMIHQVRIGFPLAYSTMMELFRRAPLFFYSFLIKNSSKGATASFSFSDVGEAWGDSRTFLKIPILDVSHIPANPYIPGFTVVFSQFNGAIKLVVAHIEETIAENEMQVFEEFLRNDLLQQ